MHATVFLIKTCSGSAKGASLQEQAPRGLRESERVWAGPSLAAVQNYGQLGKPQASKWICSWR